MKLSLVTLLFWGSFINAQEESLNFTTSHLSIVPQAPEWAPAIQDEEELETLPAFRLLLQSSPLDAEVLDTFGYPATTGAILCNISFKGTLTDNKGFTVKQNKTINYSDRVGLEFESAKHPTSTELQLKGTITYTIRSGSGTELSKGVAIKGRGEYKTDGYIIHYLPDAGEGTHEHCFIVMPPDRDSDSAAAIVGVIFKDKNGKVWSTENGALKQEEIMYASDAICFTTEEKAATDKGTLQIILAGKGKTYTTTVNQSVSLAPAPPTEDLPTTAKKVQLRHVKTEFHPQATAPEEACFEMLWWQCKLPHQTRAKKENAAFCDDCITTDIQFDGTVKDETGYTLPLQAASVEYESTDYSDDWVGDHHFIVRLVNHRDLPNGLKLHVTGTLTFTVCDPSKYDKTEPVMVSKNADTQTAPFTIQFLARKDEYIEEEDLDAEHIEEEIVEGEQHILRIQTDEAHKNELNRICGITVTGTSKHDWRMEEREPHHTYVDFVYDGNRQLPETLEIQLHRAKGGQPYTSTIDQVIDLGNNK